MLPQDFVSELAGRRNAKLAINWNAHARDRMRSLVAVIRIGRPSVRQLNVRPRPEELISSALYPSTSSRLPAEYERSPTGVHSTREAGGLSIVGVGVAQANGVRAAAKLSASWSLFPRAGLVTLISGADQ